MKEQTMGGIFRSDQADLAWSVYEGASARGNIRELRLDDARNSPGSARFFRGGS
jgi:hypothetical protein